MIPNYSKRMVFQTNLRLKKKTYSMVIKFLTIFVYSYPELTNLIRKFEVNFILFNGYI